MKQEIQDLKEFEELVKSLEYEKCNNKLPISFDFDGTITELNNYPFCNTLRFGVVECINTLFGLGYPIIIHTCRCTGTPIQNDAFIRMVNFLNTQGIIYTTINRNAVSFDINGPHDKPYAVLYIDDATLGFNKSITGYRLFINIIKYIENLKKKYKNDNCN